MLHGNPFSPSFSAVPTMFFGREKYLQAAQQGLEDPRSPYRAFFLVGTRGSGKTVLLHHIAELARDQGWLACEVHASHAASRVKSLLEKHVPLSRKRVAVAPKATLPDGTTLSGIEAKYERGSAAGGAFLAEVLAQACASLKRNNGILIAIDEAQKISEEDAEEISGAVQSAKSQGLQVMLVMAGLPRCKERIEGFAGCTFLRRARSLVLKPLTRTETSEAFRALFARVPEIGVTDSQFDEMERFTQGHPYLVQLLGYSVYEHVDRLCGADLGHAIEAIPLGDGELAAAKDEAYWRYRHDVLEAVMDEMGERAGAYVCALAETMDDRGMMESGKPSVDRMRDRGWEGASAADAAYYRDRLIKLCVLQAAGRGKVKFLLPYVPRALSEDALEIPVDDVDEDDWPVNV